MTEDNDNRSLLALRAYVQEIHDDYEVWYAKSVRRYYRAYYTLQVLTMLSGFFSAVLAALATNVTFSWERPALIVLPFVASLAAVCLYQFRIYDLWRIREGGRLDFQDLHAKGEQLLGSVSGGDDCVKAHEELRTLVTKIERDQSDKFFAVRDSRFIATFTPVQRMTKAEKEQERPELC